MVKDQSEASCFRVFTVRTLNFFRLSLFGPIYIVTFVGMHTFMLNVVRGIGLLAYVNNFEMTIWGRMHGQKQNPMEYVQKLKKK